jgi:hypothetical protein
MLVSLSAIACRWNLSLVEFSFSPKELIYSPMAVAVGFFCHFDDIKNKRAIIKGIGLIPISIKVCSLSTRLALMR